MAVPLATRRHLAGCVHCQGRMRGIEETMGAVAGLLAMPAPALDTARAFGRLQGWLAADVGNVGSANGHAKRGTRLGTPQWRGLPGERHFMRPLTGVGVAAALVASFALTPAGTLARDFITIFQPQQFASVSLDDTDLQSLRSLPDLSAYGATEWPRTQLEPVAGAAEAARRSGLAMVRPGTLPGDVTGRRSYAVLAPGTASFTFSAARVRATVARRHAALPLLPPGLDGSTLRVRIGPAIVTTFGGSAVGVATEGHRDTGFGALPTLVIAQAAAPVVQSSGASVASIEGYLLRLPGISPHLATQIRAIGDPSATLPIPVPISLASAERVTVQGVQGLAVGDETVLGSGVIWQKGGQIFGVAGTLPESEVISIANTLHP